MRMTILRQPDLGARLLSAGAVLDVPPLEAARIGAAGQAVETPGARPNVALDFIYYGTFAGLPSAALYNAALALVTDIAGQALTVVRSNGTVWRPVGTTILGSYNAGATAATYAAGGAEALVGAEFRIPGGFVQPGDLLEFVALAYNDTADTNTRGINVRQSTVAGFTNYGSVNRIARFTTASSTQTLAAIRKMCIVADNTNVVCPSASSTGDAASANVPLTEPVNTFAADSYCRFTAAPTAGANWRIHSMALLHYPGA